MEHKQLRNSYRSTRWGFLKSQGIRENGSRAIYSLCRRKARTDFSSLEEQNLSKLQSSSLQAQERKTSAALVPVWAWKFLAYAKCIERFLFIRPFLLKSAAPTRYEASFRALRTNLQPTVVTPLLLSPSSHGAKRSIIAWFG